MLVGLGVVAVWNAWSYPPLGGYDAEDYIAYARDLVDRGVFPDGVGAYYTPPGFMAVAGLATKLGTWLALEDPERMGQLFNAVAVVAAGVLVYLLARVLWPARPLIWFASVGFFAFFPTVVKTSAMFHPEPLATVLTAGALVVLARMVRRRSYTWRLALPLGLLLGAGQLVRAWSLWMVGVAIVVLCVAALVDRPARRSALVALATVLVVAILVPAPWYAYQASRYSNPVFDQPQPEESLLARRPLSFYVDARFPDVVTRPWRDNFNKEFIPVFYAESWGDYFGFWSWGSARGERTDATDSELRRQSLVGLLPTTLALTGVLALLGLAVARPRDAPLRLVAALPPVAGTTAVLYFAVAYPTSDGDTVKGTYAMAAIPALAVCFGFAVDTLATRRIVAIPLAGALAVSALVSLPFLVW